MSPPDAATAGASGAKAKPLSFMEKIDPLVYVYRPTESEASVVVADEQPHPRLIVVASWTDARDAHIAKYVDKYREMYPAAQVLLLKSHMKQIVQPSLIGPSMKHATSVIRTVFPAATSSSSSSSSSPAEIVIHILSNGGSGSLANLYEQFDTTAGPGQDKRLPPHVTIFDSSPGVFSIPRAVAFANVGFSLFQRLIIAPVLYIVAALWYALIILGIAPNALNDWGRAHNDHEGNRAEKRRVYIYSENDALIDYRSVESHAANAKEKGFVTSLVKYENSAHVSHLRKDEVRYWQIVRGVIEGS